ncbi:hypothetical protein [Pseudochrobactrum kiredjianiae]|uniref:Uncharacterized protein n=1 Tax=Pseudochrobactrum kiredjianiae TaxID=386305 RepID=A0ABW3V2Q0_9HYPH|nr:hypothetical protein [Pseudochrobactrum kiredjianiae]MDM7853212.1 hypothetical protein [Pseudochrobactrum kiredjianiae]
MAEIFEWKSDADQVYTERYGSQVQTGRASDFNKHDNRYFIMDADGCELVLQANQDTQTGLTCWPSPESDLGQGTYPTIYVRRGILKAQGMAQFNCGAMNDPFYPRLMKLAVEDDGHFVIEAQFVYFSSLKIDFADQPKVSISGNALFDVDADYIFMPSGHINVEDNAIVNFYANKFYAHLEAFMPSLALAPRITLGEGTPTVQFNGKSPDFPVIDFIQTDFIDEGVFNLKSGTKGKFVFKGIDNAFQRTAMLNKKVIAVDGITDANYVSRKLDLRNDILDGNLTVSLIY